MRSYEYMGGPNPLTGRSIKIFEDPNQDPATWTAKVSETDLQENPNFFEQLFMETPTNIIAVKEHPRHELHLYVHPSEYDLVIGNFEDPTILLETSCWT